MRKNKAQVTIELTLCLSVVFILIIGITWIFAWLNNETVHRNSLYETTRVMSGYHVGLELGAFDIFNLGAIDVPLAPVAEFMMDLSDTQRAGSLKNKMWREWQ